MGVGFVIVAAMLYR